jgi:hypothetical protein
MIKHTVVTAFAFLLLFLNVTGRTTSGPASMQGKVPMSQPLRFEENKGQVWNENQQPSIQVKFHAAQKGMHIFLMENGLAYQFEQYHYPGGYDRSPLAHRSGLNQNMQEADIRLETHRVDMELMGANLQAFITAEGRSTDYVHYYNRGVMDVRSYSRVIYHNVYPAIDWVVYTGEEGIKYDFIVHPGGNPAHIKLLFRYHDGLAVNQDEALEIKTAMGMLTEARPFSYQGTQQIASAFQLEGDTVTFQIGKYDVHQPLVIDPYLRWASYYGGASYEAFSSCETAINGDLYLAGDAQSSTNIAAGGHQINWGGGYDAFLVKMDSTCQRIWATYYGGTAADHGTNMDVDGVGNVYLMGFTRSTTNISYNGHQANLSGTQDAYIVKFDATGQRQWATYYGGSSGEIGEGCTIDANGNVYLTGITSSTNGIAFNGFQNSLAGSQNAFLVKFNSAGQQQWGTYYGGMGNTIAVGCSHDALGNVYFTGETNSTTGIASNGFQNTYGGGSNDAYVVKFNPNGNRIWGSYYGGAGGETGYGCRASADGRFYLAGYTSSSSGIAQGGHQNSLGGSSDAFLARFDSSCNRLWATYYGGTNAEVAHTCTRDVQGVVMLVGETSSTNAIAFNGHQNIFGGGTQDGFVAIFDSLGQRKWATYYGGSLQDQLSGITTWGPNTLYAAGFARTTTGMTLNGFQNTYGGGSHDALMVKFADSCSVTNQSLNLTACDSISVNGTTYNASGNYFQQLTNARGCDSLLNLSIVILPSNAGSFSLSNCGETSINGQLYMQSGIYVQHLTASNGCDSVLTINLNILSTADSTITVNSCDSAIVNGQIYHQSGSYAQYLTAANGCDSILTLNLTILSGSDSAITISECDSANVNGQIYHQSGNYVQHLTAANGCDSTLTLNLTILPNMDTTIAIEACDSAQANGQVFHQSGNYIQHLTAANGCDSMITLMVNIDTLIATISGSGATFTAHPANATYQWIDCDAGGLVVQGATSQSYTANISGSYAVIVTRGLCTDTTACESMVTTTALSQTRITISPNPTTGPLRITLFATEDPTATLALTDIQGKTIITQQLTTYEHLLDLTPLASGIYLIAIHHPTITSFAKVVKQ